MKLKTKQALTGLLLCVPIMVGIVFLYLLPFGMALWRSFHQGMSDTFVGLENYIALFGNSAFQLAAKNTLLFWGIAFPMNLAVGLLLALLCERVAASTAKSILFFPAMLPAACVVAVVRTLLAVLPSGDGGYAGGAGVALMLLIYLWKSVGYTVIILATALHTIPKEIIESAADAGANAWQTFWYIKLPLILPAMGVSLIVALLNSFRVFRETFLLGGTHPDNALYSLQHFLYNNFANMNYPRLAAASVLLIIMITLATGLAWWKTARKEKR